MRSDRHSILIWLACVAASSRLLAADGVDYEKQIKPLLTQRCATCHGPLKQESGLRVDAASLLKRGGDAGPAVVPGDVARSLLIDAVLGANGIERMPKDAPPLTAGEIELLKQWIAEGAPAPSDEKVAAGPADHWAFKIPVRPPLPETKHAAWVRTPIDTFIAAEHEKRGLIPTREAPKRVLLRRVSLDLTGLPPTPDELRAFLADESPEAYEKAVDRLLDSPRYGERWGRHWMDVWRYSDWYGYGAELRNSSRHIWRWRDWIVDSLNDDKPYDRMILEMLAGDELDPGNAETLRATGFLTRQYFKFNRNVWLDNTIEHTSKAFLGVTLNCARCHDHKYDPVSQEAYYQFRAIFEPYQVRTDRLTDADLTKDGLDLAYDATLKTETFLFDRGNEATPVKDKPLGPAVPAALSKSEFAIAPVKLPPSQWYPAIKPDVQKSLLAEADAKITTAASEQAKAETSLAAAQAALAEVRTRIEGTVALAELPGEPDEPQESPAGAKGAQPFLIDNFAAANEKLWKLGAGQWEYANGRLLQKEVASAFRGITSVANHPRDVSIEFRFKTTGGATYKSVGVSFDQSDDKTFDAVYASAYAAGPMVRVFHTRGGQPAYPANGIKSLPIAVEKEYTLRVDLRDRLLNVSLDGQFLFAYRLAERRDGRLGLWTYDATAEFLSLRVEPLAASAKLVEPSAPSTPAATATTAPVRELTLAEAEATVADAALSARIAAKRTELARASREFVASRITADNAKHAAPASADAPHLARAAVKQQRDEAFLAAEAAVLQAELDHAKAARIAAVDTSKAKPAEDAKKKVETAKQQLEAARANRDKIDENYTPLGPVYPAESTGRRLALARWIADRNNPLTARVAVNHLWMRHFGQPLVPTVFDFGLNGKPPSHPELLDWLACELVEGRESRVKGRGTEPAAASPSVPGPSAFDPPPSWRMKHIHRLMLLSSTYRMDSAAPSDAPSVARPEPLDPRPSTDPDNRFYWRMNARRMEAEAVRDSILAVAGNLDPKRGGPELDEKLGLTTTRRSLYYRHAPEKFMTFLEVFDSANTTECYRRIETVVPQQALALVNSQLALEQARRFAAKLSTESGPANTPETATAFIDRAFEQILCRLPTDEERSTCRQFLADQTTRLADPKTLTAFNTGSALSVKASTDPHQRARENLVHVLFNHTEFVTIR